MATQQEEILLRVQLDANSVKSELVNVKSNITDLKAVNKELAKEAAAALAANDPTKYAELSNQIVENEAAVRNLATQQKNLQKTLDLATMAAQAQDGSYEQLYRTWQLADAQLKLTAGTLKTNADGTIELTDAYKAQSKAVADAKAGLVEFGKGILDGRLNVGNYDNSLQGLEQKLADLKLLFQTMDTNAPEFEKTREAIAETELSIGQLSGKLDEFGDKEPKNPAKKAFEDATDTANGLVGAFTLVTLVGGKNENAAKLQAKAMQALAIMQALVNIKKGIGAAIDTASLIKTKAITAATYAQAVAQKVLNAIMDANPVAIIVLAIITLIAIFVALKDKVKIIGDAFKILGEIFSAIGDALAWLGSALGIWGESEEDRVNKSIKANEKLLKDQENSYNRKIRLLNAEGRNTQDLEKEKLAAMNETVASQIKNLEKLQEINKKLTDEQKDQLEELKNTYADNANEIEAIEIEKAKRLKEISDKATTDALSNQIKATELSGKQSFQLQKSLIEEQRKQALAAADLTADQIKNINDASDNQLKEVDKKRTEFGKKQADDRLKIENDLQKSRIALIKNTEEQAIKAEQQALAERLQQIKGHTERENELRENLTKASEERQAAIRQQFEDDYLKRTIENAQKRIEVEMISVRAGSQQEHDLKLQALAAQRAAELQSKQVSLQKQLEAGVISQKDYDEEIKLIDDKYRALSEKENKDFNDRVKATALQNVVDKAKAELIIAQTSNENIFRQSLHYQKITFDQQMKLLEAEKAAALNNAELTDAQRIVLEAEFQQKKKQLEDAAQAQRLQNVQNTFDMEMQFVALAANFSNGMEKNRNDKKLQDIDSETAASIASLQEQLDAGVLSQQDFDDAKAGIEAEANDRTNKIKKEQAESDKQTALFNAIISGAAAVVKALPNIPLAILAGLTAAAQIRLIETAPLPAFADGGRTPLSGRRIGRNDGVPIYRSNGDNLLATVKRGEVILNETQQALLGGPKTFSSIGVPGFAGGGSTSFAPVALSTTGTANGISKFDIANIAQQIGSNIPAPVLIISEFENAQNTKNKVRNRANI
jgi:hypothetical protein